MASSALEVGAGDSIDHTVQFLLDCHEKGRDLRNKRSPSAFMVPSVYRDLSPTSFNPRVVSIGPLHRQDERLQEFEVEKMPYLHYLLDRPGSSQERMLQECVEKVSSKIEVIKAFYVQSTTDNDVDLVRMMVIDGCFILGICQAMSKGDGPTHRNMLISESIATDMVLIENQIPFFVLKDIFDITILPFKPTASLTKHLRKLLRSLNIFRDNLVSTIVSLDGTPDHILGLLHKSLQPVDHHPLQNDNDTAPKGHSAVELARAGVYFRPNDDVNWALAMKVELPRFSCFPWFWCKPTLKMPKVEIDDNTKLILSNLIVYERSCGVPSYVTTYAWAMDTLIDTQEDVSKLVKSGVLINHLGSNKEAANMINTIGKEVPLFEFYYHQEWKQLDTYYNSYWPNFAAGLKRRYFSNPWTMIALFAAIILFVLTVVQTIFQVKA